VIQAAATSMLQIQGDRAVPAIAPAIDLLPGYLRSSLVEALGPVNGPLALETLLARARDSTDVQEQAGAASAFAKRPADAAVSIPLLRGLLSSKDFTVVCSAAEALGSREVHGAHARPLSAHRQSRAKHPAPRRSRPQDRRRAGFCVAVGRAAEIATTALGLPRFRRGGTRGARSIPNQPAVWPRSRRRRARPIASTRRPRRAPSRTSRGSRGGPLRWTHRPSSERAVLSRGDGWESRLSIPCETTRSPMRPARWAWRNGEGHGGSQSPSRLAAATADGTPHQVAGGWTVERIMPGDRILKITIR
jgi:hypothetical protein